MTGPNQAQFGLCCGENSGHLDVPQLLGLITLMQAQIHICGTLQTRPAGMSTNGMALLTLTAFVSGIKPSCHGDDCHPTKGQTAVFFIALYLIALVSGRIKPCVSSFGADQFDEIDESENKKKSCFFNWFYFSIDISTVIASSVLVWIQMNVSWGWGFGIPAVARAIRVVSFFFRTRLYHHQKPSGRPITRIFQVLIAYFRKFQVKVPADKSLLYENAEDESAIQGSRKLDHTKQFGFLDKAAVLMETDDIKDNVNPWRRS